MGRKGAGGTGMGAACLHLTGMWTGESGGSGLKAVPRVLQPGSGGCRVVWGGGSTRAWLGWPEGTRLCLHLHRGFSQSQAQSQGFLRLSPALSPWPPSL